MQSIFSQEQLCRDEVEPVDEIHSFLAKKGSSAARMWEGCEQGGIAVDRSELLHAF